MSLSSLDPPFGIALRSQQLYVMLSQQPRDLRKLSGEVQTRTETTFPFVYFREISNQGQNFLFFLSDTMST